VTGRVLLLASPGIGPARAAWRLLEQGFTLAACWHGRGRQQGDWRRDAALGRRNPPFSLTAALAAAGIAPRSVPPLARWAAWPAAFDEAAPDLVVSAHFHWKVPAALLRRLPGRAVNLHPTLLPHYRGPSGHSALLADGAGPWAAGVTLHLMDEGFDSGAILAQRPVPFRPGADAVDWEIETARAYAALLDEALLPYLAGRLAPRPQEPGSGSYAAITGAALNLDGSVPLERARRIVEIFGQWRSIILRAPAGTWRVRPPLTPLGPATGAPPRLRLLRLEVDLADARVRLPRALSGHGRRLRRRRRRRFAAARP
jgi:methionyl-tRNA formyltransferase